MSGTIDLESNIDVINEYGLNINNREIFVYSLTGIDEDDDGFEINHVVASTFIKNLSILSNISNDPILIHSIVEGGHLQHGFSMYDSIKTCPCYITILSYIAYSMSTIYIQAADLRILMPSCSMYIHEVNGDISGQTSSIRKESEHWIKESEKIYNIYTDKCINGKFFQERGYNRSRIKSYLKKHSEAGFYLSPEEAVEFGLADGILGVEPYKFVKDLLK